MKQRLEDLLDWMILLMLLIFVMPLFGVFFIVLWSLILS